MKCQDHLGNEFPSKKVMCAHYEISYDDVFIKRIRKGWTLEMALTTPVKHKSKHYGYVMDVKSLYTDDMGCVVDHDNNHFATLKDMIEQYGVVRNTFLKQLSSGKSLKDVLMKGRETHIEIKETAIKVFNVYYPNTSKIAEEFGVSRSSIDGHIKDLESYLLELERYPFEGKIYGTLTAVSAACKIPLHTLRDRLSSGWSYEDAVTTPVRQAGPRKPCDDHLGNHYPSVLDMMDAYEIPYDVYYDRKNKKWPLEKILTTPVKSIGLAVIKYSE